MEKQWIIYLIGAIYGLIVMGFGEYMRIIGNKVVLYTILLAVLLNIINMFIINRYLL